MEMPIQKCTSFTSISLLCLLCLLPLAFGYGLAGPIAAAFGEKGFFCAIDASGKQQIICWDKQNQSSSTTYFSSLPPMVSLSGGDGFMCGVTTNASKPYCWSLANLGTDLVPEAYKHVSYSQMASGKYHVCAIRGEYYSKTDAGSVDCWWFGSNSDISPESFSGDHSINGVVFRSVVSGEGFSCGVVRDSGGGGGVICWGPKCGNLGLSSVSGDFKSLASGRQSVCGIGAVSGEVECWGEANEFGSPPNRTRFTSLSVGSQHYCGIREDDHGVECWGSIDSSSVPKGSGFTGIASSDFTTCGVREVDLVLDCWGVHGQSTPDYSPPLQLCSPGVCSPGSCAAGKFAFNASALNEPGLTSLCARKDLKICLPCGTSCSEGYFPSSVCSENADRVCTASSLCQNSSCWDICKISSSSPVGIREQERQEIIRKLIIIIASLISGSLLLLICWFLFTRIFRTKREEKGRIICCNFCTGKQVVEADPEIHSQPSLSVTSCIGTTQVFRLSELKDATHGFKEYNELGRGNFGFVYKAVLSDGSQVAIKRANAATIIHTNIKEFEAELEILCNMRHTSIVNLLGYCAEMGERLLVYEYMPHGTLHDHLHGELSPLDWNLRLKISLQAAKGLEYLHKEVKPPIAHRHVKTSNILLDSEWGARISDFGLLSASDKDLKRDMADDVYNFGIVLLEILSGRKAYDRDCSPPGIVDWALPVIRNGKAVAIVDRNVALPRNVESLLKLADVAELSLRENPHERPSMSEIVSSLDQILKSGVTMQATI